MAAAEQMIYQPIETAPVKMWQLKINQNWSETLQDNNSALWLEGGIYTSSPTGGSVLKRTCCSVQVTGDTLEKSDKTEDTRGKKKEELKVAIGRTSGPMKWLFSHSRVWPFLLRSPYF